MFLYQGAFVFERVFLGSGLDRCPVSFFPFTKKGKYDIFSSAFSEGLDKRTPCFLCVRILVLEGRVGGNLGKE